MLMTERDLWQSHLTRSALKTPSILGSNHTGRHCDGKQSLNERHNLLTDGWMDARTEIKIAMRSTLSTNSNNHVTKTA